MKLIEYTDSDLMWLALADSIAGELNRALQMHERATLAVPGGTTPGPVFDVLSAISLEWDRVDVLLTDERWVPETSPRSNARLLRQHFLVEKAANANFIPYYREDESPDDAIAEIAGRIQALCPLSIVLLGMGEDMHTASLFPGADNLKLGMKEGAPALLPMRAPGAEEPRVTLSAEALNGAMNKHLVILGDAKLEALKKAEKIDDPMRAPISAVMDDLVVHWAKR